MFIKFTILPVDDVDRAVAFYTGKLRLTLTTDVAMDGGRWVELALPEGPTILLLQPRDRPASDAPDAMPALILVVPDVDATYERLDTLGVAFTAPPATAPWDETVRYATFIDSEGNRIMVEAGRTIRSGA